MDMHRQKAESEVDCMANLGFIVWALRTYEFARMHESPDSVSSVTT